MIKPEWFKEAQTQDSEFAYRVVPESEYQRMSEELEDLRRRNHVQESNILYLTSDSPSKWELEMELQNFRANYTEQVRTTEAYTLEIAYLRDQTQKYAQDISLLYAENQDLRAENERLQLQIQAVKFLLGE